MLYSVEAMVWKSRCVGMPFSNGMPIPPAPGDWLELPAWARERDPYRGVPMLTTSKASSLAVHQGGQMASAGVMVTSAEKQHSTIKPKPNAPKLLQRYNVSSPVQSHGSGVLMEKRVNYAEPEGVFKRHAEEPDEKQGERRGRKRPPAPMAAPPVRQIAEMDPDTLRGRTSLNLPALERFSRYVEGFVNDEFVAMRKHLAAMAPLDVLGVQLSASNVHLLSSFLAAARIHVSDVAENFQVLHQEERRIWIVPLLNMWSPAHGSPQLLARSGWYPYWFAHGSDDVGLLGILQYRKMRRSLPEEKYPTSGFFCAATHDVHEKVWPILRCWSSSKNQAGVVVVGMAANQKPHRKVETGGTFAEQEECSRGHVVHNSRQKRWCIHPDITQVLGLAVVQKASLDVVS